MGDKISFEEMLEALEEYYEAAGLADVRAKELDGKTEEEIRAIYNSVFEE